MNSTYQQLCHNLELLKLTQMQMHLSDVADFVVAKQLSFSEGLLEYPQYTRPVEFRGLRVPAVLQSGDHGAITRWRRQQAEKLTRRLRPDLYKKAVFKRLAGIPMKEWKKTTKKFLIQKEILKNGNSQESRSGIPEK